MEGSVFTNKDISVFGQVMRTNNDLQGWHYHMNHRGEKVNLTLYLTAHILHVEAKAGGRNVTTCVQGTHLLGEVIKGSNYTKVPSGSLGFLHRGAENCIIFVNCW